MNPAPPIVRHLVAILTQDCWLKWRRREMWGISNFGNLLQMLRAQANTNASEHSTQSKYRNIIFPIGANLLLLKDRGSIHTNKFLHLYKGTLGHWGKSSTGPSYYAEMHWNLLLYQLYLYLIKKHDMLFTACYLIFEQKIFNVLEAGNRKERILGNKILRIAKWLFNIHFFMNLFQVCFKISMTLMTNWNPQHWCHQNYWQCAVLWKDLTVSLIQIYLPLTHSTRHQHHLCNFTQSFESRQYIWGLWV